MAPTTRDPVQKFLMDYAFYHEVARDLSSNQNCKMKSKDFINGPDGI